MGMFAKLRSRNARKAEQEAGQQPRGAATPQAKVEPAAMAARTTLESRGDGPVTGPASHAGGSASPQPRRQPDQLIQQPDQPIQQVEPVVHGEGWMPQLKALGKYMTSTEVHTYAFSVAANVILSLFPFIVLLFTLADKVFHSPAMGLVVGDFVKGFLPGDQNRVIRSLARLAHPRHGVRLFSFFMLFVSSTGVFLPLEVALNQVWGVKENRSYLANQVVSLGLAVAVGALAMASVALSAGQRSLMEWLFLGHTDNVVFSFLAEAVLKFCAVIASVLLFFLIYWILPKRKIPAMAVLPTAVVIGLSWEVAKYIYVLLLPKLDFDSVYGPFGNVVTLMMWSFVSGLLLLAGAHFSATRYALQVTQEDASQN